jgi:hypothetical protein
MDSKKGLKIDLPGGEVQHTAEELFHVMKVAGCSPTIISATNYTLENLRKDPDISQSTYDAQVNMLFLRHNTTMIRMVRMALYDDDCPSFKDISSEIANDTMNIVFDEEAAEQYVNELSLSFIQIHKAAQALSGSIPEIGDFYRLIETEGIPEQHQFVLDKNINVKVFRAALCDNFGYWLTDTMIDVFAIDPSLRQQVHDFVGENRGQILGDKPANIIRAAENFLEIIEQIDDHLDGADVYKDTFCYRIFQTMHHYGKVEGLLDDIDIRVHRLEAALPQTEPTDKGRHSLQPNNSGKKPKPKAAMVATKDKKLNELLSLTIDEITPKKLGDVMREAGFASPIVKAFKDMSTEKNLARLYRQCAEVLNEVIAMTHVGQVVDDERVADAKEGILDEEIGEEYLRRLDEDFLNAVVYAVRLLETFNLSGAVIEESQDEVERQALVDVAKVKQEKDKISCKNSSLFVDARFGYWLTHMFSDLYYISPKLRPEIRSYFTGKRTNILSDCESVKAQAGEWLLGKIGEIEDGEHAETYRQVLTERVEKVLELYKAARAAYAEALDFKYPEIRKAVEVAPPPADPVEVPVEAEVEVAEPAPEPVAAAVPAPVVAPTKPPHYQTVKKKSVVDVSPAEAVAAAKKAEAEWAALEAQRQAEQAAKEAQKKKDAEELAQIEAELEALELAEKAEADERARRASEIAEQQRKIRDDALNKLYEHGKPIGHDDVLKTPSPKIEIDDDEKARRLKLLAIQRDARKIDLVQAMEGYPNAKPEIVVLHPGKHKIEILMQIIDTETGDIDDDIIVLDGDRTGTAYYVAYRKELLAAIDWADIRDKQTGKRADEKGFGPDDLMYFMMRKGRESMQEYGIMRVTHHGKDVPAKLVKAIEELRQSRIELKISREI